MSYDELTRSLDMEPDGITSAKTRDPPGQFSVYIPSGDTWDEKYRLSTFSQFHNVAVIPTELAAAGFYYTGFKDSVKCFSCGLNVENWIQGDNVSDKRWHQSNCDFANGQQTFNKPIGGAFKRWRLTTPWLQNTSTSAGSSTGSESRQPTLTSNSITISGGNYVQQNIPSQNSTEAHSVRSTTNNVQSQQEYACKSPLNPHMTSLIKRLESFKTRNGIRWPSEKMRASVDDLANAGFFFLSERDRVKCFYCNGRLQNWEYEDDPWTEHAKWFPSCEYALRVKGPAFVQNIVNQFSNVERPTPTRPSPCLANKPATTNNVQSQQNYARNFLLNPHITSVLRRLESFKNGIGWPIGKLRASVDEYQPEPDFVQDIVFQSPNFLKSAPIPLSESVANHDWLPAPSIDMHRLDPNVSWREPNIGNYRPQRNVADSHQDDPGNTTVNNVYTMICQCFMGGY